MATRSSWRSAAYFIRAFRPSYTSLRSQLCSLRQQCIRSPGILLVIPAAGLLRSISFFKKSAKQMETVEEQQAPSEAFQVAEICVQADGLFDNHNYAELLALMRKHAHMENDEIQWRLARALNENSKVTQDKATKKQMVFEAFDTVKKALALNDKNFACHKWYAILLDKTAEYEGTKARISQAYVVKEHFMKASELNPKDATTYYTLGVWCFLFADMAWYQRKIAAALFGTPPTSTYEEALGYFQKAEETEPNFFSKNLMMLGKTYLCMGNKEMAKLYLTRAWEFNVITPDDQEAHKEAGELLSKLGVKLSS